MSQPITLFDFQEEAVGRLTEAIEEWVTEFSQRVRYWGTIPIPFVGHLKAVTGAGKTPILSKVVGSLEPALVLWTSKSSAVVEQTYRNLVGKYRHLLPNDVQILRERPSKGEWEQLIEAESGLTIWVTTVGSWNEAEAASAGGSESARLNMHRPHPDWGGDMSPWEQLRTSLKRPIWVVYDESHNQTPAQLDQLVGLKPIGFLLASATPPQSPRFTEFAKVIDEDDVMRSIAEKGRVRVSTKDVVEKQLLKHTIAVENFDSDPDQLLDSVVVLHRQLEEAARQSHASIQPKALYVVEKSNPVKDDLVARPVAIWEHLRARGVPAREIAIYTQTKVVPDEAERVSSLSELQAHHRHIICNRSLQEGWDDPEVYIEYFDDESNSYVRIAQIIGRAIRQPGAQHFADDVLNTATLYVRVPNKRFEEIIEGLKKELSLYSTDDGQVLDAPAIRVRTKSDPLPEVPLKPEFNNALKLPNYQLGEADMAEEIAKIRAISRQMFDAQDLLAPGQRRILKISLRGESDDTRYEVLAASLRRKNGEYLHRRIQARSRHCVHLLEPEIFTGPAFEQKSCSGSVAQKLLSERADSVVQAFENTVEIVPVHILGGETWVAAPHRPNSGQMSAFRNAAHERYSTRAFNSDELEFAKTIDDLNVGTWMRNPSRGDGYGVQLPMKVGDSSTFYPDFLWWIGDRCLALDPTGRHILNEKVRGKLLTIDQPRIILLSRGRVMNDWSSVAEADGWTIVRPRVNRSPAPEFFSSLIDALKKIAAIA
ncbi:hypothetical protein [Streptomyces sp. NPDC049744]|uniref:DEAD/DEAH box helicase n=1 Tax=Streptomyces sp. NPDC049744 TaxID=3154359 RepID=UPI0034415A3C